MKTPSSIRKKAGGFTIIEIMISMTILSFIALAVYQNTTQSFILRDNVENEGDFYNSIRVALDVMGRDLNQIYTPQSAAFPGEMTKKDKQPGDEQAQGQNPNISAPAQVTPATDFWGEGTNVFGLRPSRIKGESSKISFVSNSHMRLFRDSAESDFARITYAVEDDKNAPRDAPYKTLIKREDPVVFEETNRLQSDTEVSYPLLSNIKSLQFNYLDRDQDRWDQRWDTMDIMHRDKYPAVIEVVLEMYVPTKDTQAPRNTFKVVQRYRPELPL